MEALIALLALVALGALSLRFGHDSRDGLRSAEHGLALRGVRWTDRPASHPVTSDSPAAAPYPTLARLDRARGAGSPRLSAAANAASLESHARGLIAEYWGDTVWLTGHVSTEAFRRVVEELDALRIDEVRLRTTAGVEVSLAEPMPEVGSAVAQMEPELLARAS